MDQKSTIAINIETDEMQRIAEVLVESYLANNIRQHIPRRYVILKLLKKIAATSGQYIGIMVSLVGANIITKMLEKQEKYVAITENDVLTQVFTNENVTNVLNEETCGHEFGCDHYVCWRTCTENKDKPELDTWCYTSPTPEKRDYHDCKDYNDCSPCWGCINDCRNTKKK